MTELDKGVGPLLTGRAFVVIARRDKGVERRAQNGAAFDVEETVETYKPIDGLADVEVTPGMRSIELFQCRGRVNAVLELLGVVGELSWVHPSSRLQESRFFLADSCDADVLGGAGDDRHMLVSHLAPREGLLSIGEFLELACDTHSLGGGGGRQPAPVAEPVNERYGTVGLVFPGLIEPPQALSKD